MDCGEDGVPDLDEVLAAAIGEDAEGCVSGVCGQHVADELVAVDYCAGGSRRGLGWSESFSWLFELGVVFDGWVGWESGEGFSREAGEVEDGFEIAVAFDEARGGGLEVGFGELGFEEEVAELEIDLGAVGQFGREFAAAFAEVLEWNAGRDAEARRR